MAHSGNFRLDLHGVEGETEGRMGGGVEMAEFIIENIGDNPSDYLDLFGKIRGQIVRCKDCRLSEGYYGECPMEFIDPEGFCHKGEPK